MKRSKSLPKLMVEIIDRDGKVLKRVDMEDPRMGFCQAYNELAGDTGSGRVARPVVSRVRGKSARAKGGAR